MWKPLGSVTATAATRELRVGTFNGALTGGTLLVRGFSNDGAETRPLSFGTLKAYASSGDAVGFARFHPQPQPACAALYCGAYEAFEGEVRFRPRDYNRKWLDVAIPARAWTVELEVWAPAAVTNPTFTLPVFRQPGGDRVFAPSTRPGGGHPLNDG